MHLESLTRQTVTLPSLGFQVQFAPGETVHTECSYKYQPQVIDGLFQASGWQACRQWRDSQDWFSITLARVPASHPL